MPEPLPEAVELMTIVFAFVVVERVMLEPARRELNLKSTPDLVSNILSPVPRLEAVLVSPDPPDALHMLSVPSVVKTYPLEGLGAS